MDTKFTWLKDGDGNKKLLQDLHHVSDVLLLQSGGCFRTRKQYLVILFFLCFSLVSFEQLWWCLLLFLVFYAAIGQTGASSLEKSVATLSSSAARITVEQAG